MQLEKSRYDPYGRRRVMKPIEPMEPIKAGPKHTTHVCTFFLSSYVVDHIDTKYALRYVANQQRTRQRASPPRHRHHTHQSSAAASCQEEYTWYLVYYNAASAPNAVVCAPPHLEAIYIYGHPLTFGVLVRATVLQQNMLECATRSIIYCVQLTIHAKSITIYVDHLDQNLPG